MEPISPELVLVDPELARVERARLEEKAFLQSLHDVEELRRALEPAPAPAEEAAVAPRRRELGRLARRRLVPAALLCSLVANGFFAAELVTRGGSPVAAPVAVNFTQPATPTTQETREQQESLTTKGSVERRVASLILAAPAGKLPRRLVDQSTGLVRNNVQVVCRGGQPRAFLCAVRLPSDAAGRGLFVSYRMKARGKGVFRWYGARPPLSR